jgi:hemerythrin-like domain-containing protein
LFTCGAVFTHVKTTPRAPAENDATGREERVVEPTQLLSEDHRLIERVLTSLDAAARALEEGRAVRASLFLDATDFVREFADGRHHRKEEQHLFPALEAAGFPRHGGPVGVMLADHEDGRRHTAALRAAAEKLAGGDASARAATVDSSRRYVSLMRQHIMKEDNMLFMMAQRALAPDTKAALVEAFGAIERDSNRARWIALADALEREAASAAAVAS